MKLEKYCILYIRRSLIACPFFMMGVHQNIPFCVLFQFMCFKHYNVMKGFIIFFLIWSLIFSPLNTWRKKRHKSYLLWTSMTVQVILNKLKYLRIHNVSIHINFYHNRFMNECIRKNFLEFPERQMTFFDLQWSLRLYS